MPYELNWQDEAHSIIRVDVQGKVTWDEFHDTGRQLADELAQASGRMDVIFNVLTGFPPGNPLPHLTSMMTKLSPHSNMGMVVNVSSRSRSELIKAFVDIVALSKRTKSTEFGTFATSIEEAIELIEKARAEEKTS
jgi:hypothetical protein